MIHKKLLSLLVLLMTAATGAWADIAVGNVFKTGSTIDFGTSSVRYKQFSGSSDNSSMGISGMVTLTYEEYSDGKHKFRFPTGSGAQFMYIVSDNNAEPWGIRVSGGEGTMGNPYSFEVLFEEQVSLSINNNKDEATFTMPASDATVDYDIVRDMEDETYPVEFSGITSNVVVKKKTGSDAYEPVTALTIQLIDQLAATDAQNIIDAEGIKVKVLKGTDNNGTITYDETNPIAYADFLADMQPGLYKIVAEPSDATTSPYIGTASLAFEALAGYPVDVAAKEYVTYYSDTDNLTEDDEDAQLYTITAVSGSTATAEEISGANKETPFLVYNSSDKDKTIILIPTDVVIAGQTHASEFVGTATATTIAASTTELSNYAFNGLEFVIVRTALSIAANKAWLEVPATTARNIQLVFADDDATAIGAVSGSPADNGDIYDLNGRKLDKKPTRKGVYVKNGQKVIIK